MSVFPLLYKVFYDRKAVSEIIENGKGRCGKVLFALAFFIAVLICVRVYAALGEPGEKMAAEVSAQLPRVVFENGEITEPENFFLRFEPDRKDVFFVMDTTDGKPAAVLSDLPSSGFYVTKKAFILKNGGKIRMISFKDLNIADMTLEREDLSGFFIRFVRALRKTTVFVSFAVLLPLLFLQYVLYSYVVSLFSFAFSSALKTEIAYDKRVRMSALALMPAVILNETAVFAGAGFRLNWWLGLVLTLIYLFCFMKESETPQKETV